MMMARNGGSESASVSVACIVCGKESVEQFLDLGQTALANKFLTRKELAAPEPTYPLRVGFCQTCGHVQLTERVAPRAIFEHYLYISSASDTLKDHLYDLSDIIVKRYQLGADDLVIDIGCNDGTLLDGFHRHGVKTLGVDPAFNLAALAQKNGIDRYVGFFNSKSAAEIIDRWGKASIITATNTFPHIPELPDFVNGIKMVLAPHGVVVLEMHYLVDLLERMAFDTIYHEHVSYWALAPMAHLFAQQGMEIVNAERLPLHHGQLRVFVQRSGVGRVQSSVAELLSREQALEIDQLSTYRRFAQRTQHLKRDLHLKLTKLRAEGKRVAGYGAPAKGNTLLSFLEIGPGTIEYIADRSPLKQGLYTPGLHIPIVPPERLLADQPDYVLLLAWNFVDEILEQQAEYRRGGGKFIIPVPEVAIIP
ncbi:MAG: class I SAM-dependent methyltransferase [Candidatus Binatia bacterium]